LLTNYDGLSVFMKLAVEFVGFKRNLGGEADPGEMN
jgi:hypothetical protein